MISTRGRYALRVMIDLAEHRNGAFIPMKEVAERQEISLKYIEKIMPVLTKSGLVEGAHGKGGGYRLKREPEDCTVWEVLRLTEGELAPVACLEPEVNVCPRAHSCRTLPMWTEYYRMTRDFFGKITLAGLMSNESGGDYVI